MGRLLLCAGLLLMTTAGQAPTPLVRERQIIVVRGITETWELRWKSAPKPACEANERSLTCPGTGFAYGEAGELNLFRIRNGEEIDHLELTPLFANTDFDTNRGAILQRWAPDYDLDFKASEKDDFQAVVSKRPVVKIMDFVDYDHDGNRSEFFLQTNTLPCGKKFGVVIGVSQFNDKLHVFGTLSRPTEPLVLQKSIWRDLSRASGPMEAIDWLCEDHGSEEESTVRLNVINGAIDGMRRIFACPRDPKQLPIREEPL